MHAGEVAVAANVDWQQNDRLRKRLEEQEELYSGLLEEYFTEEQYLCPDLVVERYLPPDMAQRVKRPRVPGVAEAGGQQEAAAQEPVLRPSSGSFARRQNYRPQQSGKSGDPGRSASAAEAPILHRGASCQTVD